MRCGKFRIMMSASIDNELTDKEKQILEQHISKCGECAHEMEALAGLRLAMSSWKDEEPSERLALSFSYILRDLADNKHKLPVRRPFISIFGKAAAGLAVMLALVGFFVKNNSVEPLDVGSAPVILYRPLTDLANNSQLKQDMTKPVPKPTIKHNTGSTVRRHSANLYAKAHKHITTKPVLVAYVPRDEYRTGDLTSRHAERIILQKMDYARSVDSETAVMVTASLDEANMKMNETIERVRGTLRTAADLLSTEQQSQNANMSATDGSKTL